MAQNASLLSELNTGQKASVLFGVLAVLGLSLVGYFWLYQVDYQPIYENLNEEDAASVVTRLQEMKVPYKVTDGGHTVLVDSRELQETRVMMDGGKISVRGGEGFELFDDIDYGMTEFAQKINYQRALQGEISRTLIGLQEVRYARVHLVLPEKTLFQKTSAEPKASISITQEPGRQLSDSQIKGIQELVASAIEGMEPRHVTLLNEEGTVLSRSQYEDEHGMASRLGQKQEMEQYLGSKTKRILDQVFGPGKAVVNVDVSLSYDQVQLTRESYSPSSKDSDSGFLERSRVQRQYKDSGSDQSTQKGKNPLYSETSEYDYKLGKSTEQIVKSAGSVERLMVSVMVPETTEDGTLLALRQLVSNAVGLRPERGDSIQIYGLPLADIERIQLDLPHRVSEPEIDSGSRAGVAVVAARPIDVTAMQPYLPFVGAGFVVMLLLIALVLFFGQSRGDGKASLSDQERRALLAEVRNWMEAEQVQSTEEGA